MKKGTCQRKRKFFGLVTITDRGQIAIPTSLRDELNIKKGDRLAIIKRKDKTGINLIKVDVLDDFLNKLSNN